MSRWFPLLLLLVACSGGGGGPPAEGADGEKKAETEPDPRTLVEVAKVTRGSVGDHLVGSATVESEAQATLVPEASGTVTAIYVEEGDPVKRGQLLAVVASPQLEGGFARAQAELDRATREAEGARRLHEQGALSRAELDIAEQALRTARVAYDEATRTRGFTRIESPIDGTVAQKNLRFGEVAGGTAAFTVVDLDRLRVVVSLPERDVARVRPGLPATLVSAYDDDQAATGRVLRVSPVVDSATGTFRVTIAVDPGQTALRPGQFVSTRIEVDRHEGVLTVPRRALVWDEGKAHVFLVRELTAEELAKEAEEKVKAEEEAKKGPGGGFAFSFGGGEAEEEEKAPEVPGPKRKAVRTPVEVGFEDGETAEILSGVAEGDAVVVVGNEALRDDARVRLPEDPTVAQAATEPKAG